MRRIDILTADLCDEIDDLKEAVEYWKSKYERERAELDRMISERIIDSQNGVKTALALAFAFQDKEDGSLSIPKENREALANKLSINKTDQP